MPQVLMNFHNNGWWVHFIEADCRTTIGRKLSGRGSPQHDNAIETQQATICENEISTSDSIIDKMRVE